MPIREWIARVVTTWKKLRPARRRRSSARFFGETFEPRRMLSAFFVNSIADSLDALPGDGIAADTNGFTTLRAALEEANAHAGADTITLPKGLFILSATNGPLVVADDVTILGSGATTIDGSAINEVFSVHGAAQLKLEHVSVVSSDALPANIRAMLLTTNTRQSDLVVAFSATPSSVFAADTKSVSGLSPFSAVTTSERVFDFSPIAPAPKIAMKDDSAIPTPEQAIDQIINALFRSEPDFVLPAGAKREPGPISDQNAQPMSKSDAEEKSSPMTPPESMSSDEDSSSENTVEDEAVGAILRNWADDAGFGGLDFLTRGSQTITAQPRRASRLAVAAGALLSGVVVNSWSQAEQDSWRDSLSLTAWRTRFERLRRRAR